MNEYRIVTIIKTRETLTPKQVSALVDKSAFVAYGELAKSNIQPDVTSKVTRTISEVKK